MATKCKYYLGDRVFAKYNGIPISGTVGNDRLISLEEGRTVTIYLDLPIKSDPNLTVVMVKQKDVVKKVIT